MSSRRMKEASFNSILFPPPIKISLYKDTNKKDTRMCKYGKVKTGSHQTCHAHNVVDAHCYAGSMEDDETLEQGM